MPPSKGNFYQLPTSWSDSISLGRLIEHKDLRYDMQLWGEVKNRFRDIVKEYVARDRLNRVWVEHKRKILLYWKPGCWKTMWAELIAYELGLPLYKVAFDSLIGSLLWVTSKNIRTVFEFANKNPCVLLIDECDAIAKSRESATHDHAELTRAVNALLILMDEFTWDSIFIATTNLDDILDKAMYRRFDDIIHIELPSEEVILSILKSKLTTISKDVDLEEVKWLLIWQSHAIVNRVCNDALKAMILWGHNEVSLSMLMKPINNLYHNLK